MAHPIWLKLKGIVNGYLKFGFAGPHVEKDVSIDNQLNIKANNGVADGIANVATVKVKTIEVSDGDANKTTITMPDGASTDLLFKLPITDGNSGDTLTTDGSGILSWSPAGASASISTYDYDLVFNTGSPMNLLNVPANTRVARIVTDVTEAFNGTAPTLSIGVSGTVEKFVAAVDIDLKNIGTYVVDVEMIQVSGAQMIATYAADSSSAGAAKIVTWSSIPQ